MNTYTIFNPKRKKDKLWFKCMACSCCCSMSSQRTRKAGMDLGGRSLAGVEKKKGQGGARPAAPSREVVNRKQGVFSNYKSNT